MKITVLPKTVLGKWAAILSIAFIILISLKMRPDIPLPTFTIAGLGLSSFVAGTIAIIKKDRSIGTFLPILVGLVIILWIIGEMLYPH